MCLCVCQSDKYWHSESERESRCQLWGQFFFSRNNKWETLSHTVIFPFFTPSSFLPSPFLLLSFLLLFWLVSSSLLLHPPHGFNDLVLTVDYNKQKTRHAQAILDSMLLHCCHLVPPIVMSLSHPSLPMYSQSREELPTTHHLLHHTHTYTHTSPLISLSPSPSRLMDTNKDDVIEYWLTLHEDRTAPVADTFSRFLRPLRSLNSVWVWETER